MLGGCWAFSFPKFRIQSVSLGQLLGEMAVVGSHLALSGHSKHGQSMIVSIDAGSLLGYSRYVHRPSWSSFSLLMRPFSSSLMETRLPSRLLAPSSRHKSDWRTPW